MSMNAKISALILAAQARGLTIGEAVDAVLGTGTFAKLAGEIYDTLRAKTPG